MLDSEDQPPSQVTILLTDAAEIRELNKRFRGISTATDVLSFPSGAGPEPEASLGDVAICLPVAEQQAAAHKISLEAELACLAVHGGLHLLGYDHETEVARARMNEKMEATVRFVGLEPARDWRSDYETYG